MYPVSEAFLQAVPENTRVIPSAKPMVMYYWTGKITTKNGVVYDFDQDDMVKGSGYITSQLCRMGQAEDRDRMGLVGFCPQDLRMTAGGDYCESLPAVFYLK